MTALSANTFRAKFLVCLAILVFISSAACRRNRNTNSNSNASTTSQNGNNPEEAKRQAQSLIDQGKEFEKNYQDEQALNAFKEAVSKDPDNGEAHLRLGMSYAALGQKTEADEEYKKAIDLLKKLTQSDSK